MKGYLLWICLLPILAQANQAPPIKVLLNNWTSQLVLSHVAGNLFEQMGYEVQYQQSSVSEQWGALSRGAAHVQVEVWEGTMAKAFDRLVLAQSIEDMGSHKATTREDWWYPDYVEKLCPGLPDWQALKTCSSLFSDEASGSIKGIYVAGPWEKPDEAKIRALGLNFEVRPVKKGDDLWVALKKAVKQKKPVMLFNWSPNWVESRYSGKFVEFPDYHPDCETDPQWGVNKRFLFDCGNPKGGWLKKAAWPGLKTQWPCAYEALKNISLSNEHIAYAAALVDVDNLSYSQAAKRWMEEYPNVWKLWLNTSCAHD